MLGHVTSTPPIPPSGSHAAQSLRRRQLEYIQLLVDTTGKNRTEIARGAGVSPSTISKFENDGDNIAQLGLSTIDKLATSTGIPFGERPVHAPVALSAPEAQALETMPGESAALSNAIEALKKSGNAVVPWVLKSRALEVIGYLPDDVLLVDLNATPRDGDIVCAQHYDRLGRAETMFRLYQKPYLTAPALSPITFRPLVVDDDRVQIQGVVIASLRARPTAH